MTRPILRLIDSVSFFTGKPYSRILGGQALEIALYVDIGTISYPKFQSRVLLLIVDKITVVTVQSLNEVNSSQFFALVQGVYNADDISSISVQRCFCGHVAICIDTWYATSYLVSDTQPEGTVMISICHSVILCLPYDYFSTAPNILE